MHSPRLLIFAKVPLPGLAKTRLIPALGAEGAAALQQRLIRLTLVTAAQSGLATELWCHPDCDQPFFAACGAEFAVELRRQQGADLGERMHHAFVTADAPALLIGTDCPALSAQDLCAAAAALNADHDAVLGPAADGGYYLIGLRRPQPALFHAMPWGTDAVLALTRTRLHAVGLCWHELPLHHDIDTPDDLVHLPKELLP
jgi:rSAM/selenodomain-associated transferase 1